MRCNETKCKQQLQSQISPRELSSIYDIGYVSDPIRFGGQYSILGKKKRKRRERRKYASEGVSFGVSGAGSGSGSGSGRNG